MAVGGRGRPVRCTICACRRRRVLRNDDTAVFKGRSLPCKCHIAESDANTYLPLRPDALNGYTMRGESRPTNRRLPCPAPRNVSLPGATSNNDPTTFARSGSRNICHRACGPSVLTPHHLLLAATRTHRPRFSSSLPDNREMKSATTLSAQYHFSPSTPRF